MRQHKKRPNYRLIGPDQPVEYMNVCEPDCVDCRVCTDVTLGIRHDVSIPDALWWLLLEVYESTPESVDEMADEVRPKDVFFGDVVTGVVWSDNSKTMTRRDPEDESNLTLALLNCYWRKRDRNRGHSDWRYPENVALSNYVRGRYDSYFPERYCMCLKPDEMRDAARALEFLADAYEILEAKREKKNRK